MLDTYFDLGLRCSNDIKAANIVKERINWEIRRNKEKRIEFDQWVNKNINLKKQKVCDYYHHHAHAASASFLSPFDDGLVYTSDGRGDFESTTIYKFNRFARNKLTKIYSASSIDSFGYFYGRITGLLDTSQCDYEGKITGLAAYGEPQKAMNLCKKMIYVRHGKIVSNLETITALFSRTLNYCKRDKQIHKRRCCSSSPSSSRKYDDRLN